MRTSATGTRAGATHTHRPRWSCVRYQCGPRRTQYQPSTKYTSSSSSLTTCTPGCTTTIGGSTTGRPIVITTWTSAPAGAARSQSASMVPERIRMKWNDARAASLPQGSVSAYPVGKAGSESLVHLRVEQAPLELHLAQGPGDDHLRFGGGEAGRRGLARE